MSEPSAPRYAVYFAPPPDHPLWLAGCAWLGRDARCVPATPPSRAEVAQPWRYGWHATLKAPMRLATGVDEAEWLAAVRSLATACPPFDMPALEIARLAGFLALRPTVSPGPGHPLRRLADDCVRELDAWRAPLTQDERTRQCGPGLTERQRDHVERYGYPHVLEAWRFHMTLTNDLSTLAEPEVAALRADAEAHFAEALRAPLRCDALAVFVEPQPGAPFEWRHRFVLGGA